MSLPSIPKVIEELGYNSATLNAEQAEQVLVEALRADMPLAVAFLHEKAHEAKEHGFAEWTQDPNSEIGKQLIRLHASDSLRPIVTEHFCHGQQLTFINCCGGVVGTPPRPKDIHVLQVHNQDGTLASADC